MTESTGLLLPPAPEQREALERLFCHDLLNLVEGLEGIAADLQKGWVTGPTAAGQLRDLGRMLCETIRSERNLMTVEGGRPLPSLREMGFPELLAKLLGFFQCHPLLQERRMELIPGPEASFQSDPALLARVLVNLVKNALEATPAGGTVRIWQESRGGERGFLVENPGVLQPGVAEQLFRESFSTKGCRDRGLGTSSAKLLGEQVLGGHIGFHCADGHTRFSLWIPDPLPGRVEAPEVLEVLEVLEPPAGSAPAEGTLLVIDDCKTVRRTLEDLLAPGHRVLLAATAVEGLALAASRVPDLILLDVLLPDQDGYAVCAQLKADACTRAIPVLFLTALSGEADEMRALEAGAIDFIPKPISPPVLAARVRNHLDLKRYQDQLRNLSLLDGLTGIGNRRRFDQYLELEWQRCMRSGHPLSLVMGDVDFFKRYNDGYGHGQGDECLRRVAEVFARSLRRPGDLAARYGGEEFVCVLPETGSEGAWMVAEQIMAQMAALAMPHGFSPVAGRVTVSVGVATAREPQPGHGWKALVEEADRCLYRAKRQGRNCIG